MKIEIENFGNISRLYFEPGDGVVPVVGMNGAGKSNFLEAMAFLFPNKSVKRGQNAGILKDGADNGRVRTETEEHIFERKFNERGARQLVVTRKDGKPVRETPGQLVHKLVGRFGLDVGRLMTMEQDKLSAFFLDVFGLSTQFEDLKDVAQGIYDERTIIGREVSKLGKPEAVEKVEKVSLSELSKELQEAVAQNQQGEKLSGDALAAVNEYELAQGRVQTATASVDRLKRELALAEDFLLASKETEERLAGVARSKAEEAELFQLVDTAPIQAKINNAESINEKATLYEKYLEAINQIEQGQAVYDQLTAKLDAARQDIKDLFNSVDYPVKGMSFDPDEGLMLNGKTRMSKGQLIHLAFALVCSQNPDLKVVLVPDGSLLDIAHRQSIENLAREKGFQVFLELVNTGQAHEGGVILEAGEMMTKAPAEAV
jgi:predicted ATP-dependent endonuclease of OLD family